MTPSMDYEFGFSGRREFQTEPHDRRTPIVDAAVENEKLAIAALTFWR